MVIIWLFMMAAVTDMHLEDLEACKAENMKPEVCRKFDPKPVEKKWW